MWCGIPAHSARGAAARAAVARDGSIKVRRFMAFTLSFGLAGTQRVYKKIGRRFPKKAPPGWMPWPPQKDAAAVERLEVEPQPELHDTRQVSRIQVQEAGVGRVSARIAGVQRRVD